jgi:hypothetical protein
MKKLYILFFFWILSLSFTKAQTNLVPNGGFEILDTCPNNVGQLNYAVNWSMINSPDYYNSCASYSITPNSSVPENFFGYQFPASGNAYAGFWAYTTTNPSYREMAETQITSPLTVGQKYYIKFKLNLTLGYTSNSGSDKFGLRFTNILHTQSNPSIINNWAHIYNNSIITDTLNWTTVFSSFVADSAYNFVEIGNFFDNANTNILPLRYQGGQNLSYYYIDDICVSMDSLYTLNWADTNHTTNTNIYYSKQSINIYPNPSSGKVFVDLKGLNNQSKISVCNIYGIEIKNLEITSDNNTIEFEESGIYFIYIISGSSKITQKIIINK